MITLRKINKKERENRGKRRGREIEIHVDIETTKSLFLARSSSSNPPPPPHTCQSISNHNYIDLHFLSQCTFIFLSTYISICLSHRLSLLILPSSLPLFLSPCLSLPLKCIAKRSITSVEKKKTSIALPPL